MQNNTLNEMSEIIESKTVNGCWNCIYGGNLKILSTILKSLQLDYNITIVPSVMSKIKNAIYNRLGKNVTCGIDPRYNCQTGFICNCWQYNNCGFREK